ncbi:MAG: hypothetical protein IPP83_13010 [Flavobacteriales bacterium]|nr:hypothetical protein [Flavobacteriales bacterium]
MLFCSLMTTMVIGQQDYSRLLSQLHSSESKSLNIDGTNYSLVSADFTVTTTNKGSYLRIAEHQQEGWSVRVLAADGDPLMTGFYSDVALTIPNGRFTYYHPNDRMECTGTFVNGVKSGVWIRYDTSGNVIAERVYTGLGTDELLMKNGPDMKAGDR